MPIFIPPISPQPPSPITRGWYNTPVVAAVPKVPPHKLKKKNPRKILLVVLQIGKAKYLSAPLRIVSCLTVFFFLPRKATNKIIIKN
jgi:hypothetical protein